MTKNLLQDCCHHSHQDIICLGERMAEILYCQRRSQGQGWNNSLVNKQGGFAMFEEVLQCLVILADDELGLRGRKSADGGPVVSSTAWDSACVFGVLSRGELVSLRSHQPWAELLMRPWRLAGAGATLPHIWSQLPWRGCDRASPLTTTTTLLSNTAPTTLTVTFLHFSQHHSFCQSLSPALQKTHPSLNQDFFFI